MKLHFIDLNKPLVEKVESLFAKYKDNKAHLELSASHGDAIKFQRDNSSFKLATASNPDFSMGGGLDGAIQKEYGEECEGLREFSITNNLVGIVSVDSNIKATREIIRRALGLVYFATRKNDVIITGLGTAIGGLSEDCFIEELGRMLNANFHSADFSSANFSYSDFSSANFRSANFRSASFRSASFRSANFSYSDFSYSDFSYSDFRHADFHSADFSSANFSYSDFSSANFRSANFRSANFRYASFRSANFSYSDFSSANFRSANFRYASFRSASFRSANFSSAKVSEIIVNEHTIGLLLSCPEKGSFTCFKKANGAIVTLLIPSSAKRSSATSRKCRASKAKVISIEKNGKKISEITSSYDNAFIYKVGETVEVKNYDDNRWNEYAPGIHFFMTRIEAECWN